MSNYYVLQCDSNTINKMANFYKEYSSQNNANSVFIAKLDKCVITAYKSGKVLFQGKNSEQEYKIWSNEEFNSKDITKTNEKQTTNKSIPNYRQGDTIGSDEVGTGDFFGPVVVCAVYLPENNINLMKQYGVDDSKKITDQKIIEIAPKIEQYVNYKIIMVDNKKYNQLTKKGYNMNKIKAILHNQAIHELLTKQNINPKQIVIDQFCTENKFKEYLTGINLCSNNLTFETKAESKYMAVAVASIFARYTFLKEMAKLNKKFDNLIVKGAGSNVDKNARIVVSKYGTDILDEIAKTNFKNMDRII